MKRTVIAGIVVFLLLSVVCIASAEKVGAVRLPDTLTVDGTQLILNGAGMRTKVIINVYAGGLYLPEKMSDAARIIEADKPMAIKMHFVRKVDNRSIIDAWNTGFKNSADEGYDTTQSKRDRFNGVFSSDIEKDGIYDVEYVPGKGVTVSIDGTEKATIPGFDFKKAVFAIWLGQTPADGKLKKKMLD